MARQALRKLIPGPIEFRPVERDGERGYDLRWSLVTKALLDGNIGVASPRRIAARPAITMIRRLALYGFKGNSDELIAQRSAARKQGRRYY